MIPLILESPNKIKKMRALLPRGHPYVILASCGHVRKLGDTHNGMGFALEPMLSIDYVEEPSKKKIIASLKQQCKGAKVIYLATDPDREGEAIAWHLMQLLGVRKDYYRIRFHSLTQKDVLAALAAPTRLDLPLVWAQQTRALMDKWIGFRVSPLCWAHKAKSAGRVQSPALKLLVQRTRTIQNFAPVAFYTLGATFDHQEQQQQDAELARYFDMPAPAPLHFATEKAALAAVATIEQTCRTWVRHCGADQTTLAHPPPPYTTLTMLQDCHTHAKLSPERAMAVLQQLYETGHITYHRTDSVALSAEGLFAARAAVQSDFGANLLSTTPRNYTTRASALAQEAHEAIRPTHFVAAIEVEDSTVARVYHLIYLRTLASQCKPRVHTVRTYTFTSPEADTDTIAFRATQSFLTDPGWRLLYNNRADAITTIPPPPIMLANGAVAKDDDFSLVTHHTTPPPHFNSSTLIQTMEHLGIGRPSTYASIVSKLLANAYMVENKARQLHPTPLGEKVVDVLEPRFHTHFMDLSYTKHMETQLDAIARGEVLHEHVLTQFISQFEAQF